MISRAALTGIRADCWIVVVCCYSTALGFFDETQGTTYNTYFACRPVFASFLVTIVIAVKCNF